MLTPFEVVGPFWVAPLLTVHHDNIRLDSSIGRLGHLAVAESLIRLNPLREVHGVPARPHHIALLILRASDVLQIPEFVVGVVAVLVGGLGVRRTVTEKRSGDQAVNRALPLESLTGRHLLCRRASRIAAEAKDKETTLEYEPAHLVRRKSARSAARR